MPSLAPFQAIILAGGGGSHLFPLNATGVPKVLLPVANRPLLTFPLRILEVAGIGDVLVVCEGDAAAGAVRAWASTNAPASLRLEIVRVPEGLPSVAALRQVIDKVKSEHVVLLSGDVVTEVPLRAQLLQHQARNATITTLLSKRRNSPAADTQPGKAPRGVDFIGLAGDLLAFYAHAPDGLKELQVPSAALRRHQNLRITTRLVDMQVYAFKSAALRAVLETKPELLKLEDHLVPYFVRLGASAAEAPGNSARIQRGSSTSLDTSEASGSAAGAALLSSETSTAATERLQGGVGTLWASQSSRSPHEPCLCLVYMPPDGSYCQRANTLQGYADVNREVVTPELAPKILRESPSARGDNFIAPGVILGVKATVGAGCMVGADSVLGDKCSVKRSVLGQGCTLGANVKVINSVLMEGVAVGDNVHIQNSIICMGCTLQSNAQVRDCHVGPKYVVPASADLKGETLALKD